MTLFQRDDAMTEGLRPDIRPRSDWAGDLAPTGPLELEEDVRFLLVHHSASGNAYNEGETADQIRSFYRLHTGPTKGWPDVAYNFFVDRFGEIWEAREGSIDHPVRGDATGGSQGFALLCCLIGDYSATPISEPQRESLTQLLAWLAARYNVDTTPGTNITFTSRGSDRWPAGTEVQAATISGHRDMSLTSCPGEVAYDLIKNALPSDVSDVRLAADDTALTTPETEEPAVSETTADPRPQLQAAPVNTAERNTGGSGLISDATSGVDRTDLVMGAAAVAGLGGVAGLLALRTRRSRANKDKRANLGVDDNPKDNDSSDDTPTENKPEDNKPGKLGPTK